MSRKSPFAIQKALKGIGGDPKAVKKLSINSNSSHRFLNSCRGVISEPDLLCASEAEILEGLSDQGVTQVRRIKIKKDSLLSPTKHLILTFNSPKLPSTIKAGYLNCKIRPYIPNPLRCFKCQRLYPRTQMYQLFTGTFRRFDKLCPKWKAEKQIQEIKTNKNITYIEARKLIAPPLTLTYSQAAKSSVTSSSTQTDETIPKPPIPKIPISNDLPSITIPSTSAILPTIQKEALSPIPILTSTTTSFAGNSLNTSASSLKTDTRLFPTTFNKFAALSTEIQPSVSFSESEATPSNNEPSNTSKISKRLKRNSKNRKRRAKEQKAEIEVKMTPLTHPRKVPAVTKSSASTQAQLLPSTSSVTGTLSSESQPPIPLTNSALSMSNCLSTPATSSSSTPFVILPSTPDGVENLSAQIQPSVPLLDISPTSSPSPPSMSKVVNRNYKLRTKRTKKQKPQIEIKISPLEPKKSYVHYTSEDEDMIVYDVEEEHFNPLTG
ncbi:uncharacterized protein TNCV_1116001 [Trichonephila clavipes]|nr:uncharacterized protein TNCV_1116001 [Trichonephila clavipes]